MLFGQLVKLIRSGPDLCKYLLSLNFSLGLIFARCNQDMTGATLLFSFIARLILLIKGFDICVADINIFGERVLT